MTSIKGKRIARTVLASAIVVALAGCAAAYKLDDVGFGSAAVGQQTTISIAYLPITHAAPLFKAKEQLEAENPNIKVELVKYGGWAELMDALNTGRVDGASVLVEMAMQAKTQGIPLKLALLGHHDGNVVVASNDIMQPSQLAGKTIAIPNKQSSHNILVQQLLESAGLSASDVTLVEMAPAEMPAGLQSGQIDGYCVAEPFGAKVVETGVGHVLATSDELWPNSICCGIVLNADAVSGKSDAVSAFEQAYECAGDSLTAEEAVEIAQTDLGQDEQTSRQSMQWISFNDLEVTREAYDKLCDEVRAFGLSDNPPSYEDFVISAGGQEG
ncbi:ABC transporter substrate-binding protein [uncultured Senegalimassilia sp.]|uniref:ABC transporter substrate-binding protein n=1 Tax=uncultured Senegalimassilia sp. TaxID=1714350 RepID=UPI00262B307C|nr:ABC transporter substrate-binding protein [uncultured Senegalimassilia sp.]